MSLNGFPDRQSSMMPDRIVALAGGVGGAKLIHGLAQTLPPENLTVIVNTGDDFEHLGLYICPDLDTVCYTLAGLANPETGWGRVEETWNAYENLIKLGGPAWFRLGDQDLATHLERTRRLMNNEPLSRIVKDFCQTWEVRPVILPMSDQPVRTIVETLGHSRLPFQEYFVRMACEPTLTGFVFEGIEKAAPAPAVLDAIRQADAVIICPSNPLVSVDPILAVPGIKTSLKDKKVVAVSPIIRGLAVKGPLAAMLKDLGMKPSAQTVAEHYHGLLKGFIMDNQDAGLEPAIKRLGMQVMLTDIFMKTMDDRRRLAQDVLNFVSSLK